MLAVCLPPSGNQVHTGLGSTALIKQNFCPLSFDPCSAPGSGNSREELNERPDQLLFRQSRSPGVGEGGAKIKGREETLTLMRWMFNIRQNQAS